LQEKLTKNNGTEGAPRGRGPPLKILRVPKFSKFE
jgi:hypothetical protein